MSEALIASIVTLIATTLTTLIVNYYAFKNSRLQWDKNFEEKRLEFQNQQLSSDKSMIIKAFQEFATTSGKTISFIDAKKDESPVDMKLISEFDTAFYNAYLMLNIDEDRNTFLRFRNALRYKAGFKHPEGLTYDDEEFAATITKEKYYKLIYEPNHLFVLHNECLEISSKYINKVLNIASYSD